jgi:hypothetical protein
MKLAGLANTYKAEIEKKDLSLKVLMKKTQDNTAELKRNGAQIKIGEDSKVDEAMMATFLTSMFKDLPKAYEAFAAYKAEKEMQGLKDKQQSLKDFIKLDENIKKYTKLNIEKTAIEKKLSQENLTPNVKEKHQNDLQKILGDMNDLADFFGYANEPDFIEELQISEEKWYGPEGAKYLREIRDLSSETLGEFVDAGVLNSQELSVDSILKDGVLDNSINKIKKELVALESVNSLTNLISEENQKSTTTDVGQN